MAQLGGGAPAECGALPAYAGIGARETPASALAAIERAAALLARCGWVLRTGGSPGADQAFYRGARSAAGRVELYLPWPGFEGRAHADIDEPPAVAVLQRARPEAWRLSSELLDGWEERSEKERALLARDAHEVLGESLRAPARLVVCWTADGGLDGRDARAGGTGQALRFAAAHGVPVVNLARAGIVPAA